MGCELGRWSAPSAGQIGRRWSISRGSGYLGRREWRSGDDRNVRPRGWARLRPLIPAQPGQAQPAYGALGGRAVWPGVLLRPQLRVPLRHAPPEWYGRGIRLLARTTLECVRDAFGDRIGRAVKGIVQASSAERVVVIDPFAGSCNALYWVLR